MGLDMTVVVGLLTSLLIVGLIGTYVGDQIVSATNLSEAHPQVEGSYNSTSTEGVYTWTAPMNVTEISLTVVGGGGSGGLASNTTARGGNGGLSGVVTTESWVSVTPGQSYVYTIGAGGFNGGNGGLSTITIGTTTYAANGGLSGTTGGNVTPNGSYGIAGYIGSLTGVPAAGSGSGGA